MLNFELAVTFLLILARVGSFLAISPLLGGEFVPGTIKGGAAIVISFLLLPSAGVPAHLEAGGLLQFALALAGEVGVGLILGFICNMILQTLNIVGNLFDLHIGFIMSNFFDPSAGGQITLIARFFYMLGIVLFFIMDGHHMLLLGLAKSFSIVPLNTAVFSGTSALVIIRAFARMVTVAVQISAPVIAAMLIIDICLGIMGRTAPQMNIFMLGFPLKMGAGMLVLAIMIPIMGVVFQSLFGTMEKDLYTLLKGLSSSG